MMTVKQISRRKFLINGTASFRHKKNAAYFKKAMKKRGLKTSVLRSSGPVVEGGHSNKAHTVLITGKYKKTHHQKHHKARRRRPTHMTLNFPRGRLF